MQVEYIIEQLSKVADDMKYSNAHGDQEEFKNDLRLFRKIVRQLAGVVRREHEDSAFFEGELEEEEEYKQEPLAHIKKEDGCDRVEAFRSRRQKRKDGRCIDSFKKRRQNRLDDKEEGRWVTTENDHKIHLNEEGVPDKGNPHVIEAMTSGTKTREEIGRCRVEKTRGKVRDALDSYKKADQKVKEAAEVYRDVNYRFKRADKKLDYIDRIYKSTLDQNGYKEEDGERLKKEVEELEKKRMENPGDRDIEGAYNKKKFFLDEYEECYGEETKQLRKEFPSLKRENDEAEAKLNKHIEERKAALKEARAHMEGRNAQSIKFYTPEERQQIKDDFFQSSGLANLTEDEKNALVESVEKASDAQLAMLKKTMVHAKVMKIEETAKASESSCYSPDSGCMYLEEPDRKDPRVFWHEYGHYMDDFKHSGLEFGVVTHGEGSTYESASKSFSDILQDDIKLRGDDGVADLQEMLDSVSKGKFEVRSNDSGDWIYVFDRESGEHVGDNPKLEFELQNTFDRAVRRYIDGGDDGGELTEYYKSINYPLDSEMPKRSDYIESYVTPKRKFEREREKYKGAEEEYRQKMSEFYDKRDMIRILHQPEFGNTVEKIYERRAEREKSLSSVTDCICGAFGGEVFSIYGCHKPDYYHWSKKVENEWAANIHQMMFMQSKESLKALSMFMPRTMKKVKRAYNEYLWRNMEI